MIRKIVLLDKSVLISLPSSDTQSNFSVQQKLVILEVDLKNKDEPNLLAHTPHQPEVWNYFIISDLHE